VGSARELDDLKTLWKKNWEPALAAWSRFTKLSEPRWCLTQKEEAAQELSGSFAMIRLQDHAVVISLKLIRERKLERFGLEILAHEIGHHVLAPGDLRDNARLLARVRAGLPGREEQAPLVANLFTDLLINDRLQRSAGLKLAEVYRALRLENADSLWVLYMRMYEILWSLPADTLISPSKNPQIELDAALGARVVRVYAKDWLKGAGRFASLLCPYLQKHGGETQRVILRPWLDTEQAGAGDEIPDGLTALDDDEEEQPIHPSEDEKITGLDPEEQNQREADAARLDGGTGKEQRGGRKNECRGPKEYTDLMRSLGVKVPGKEVVMRYYRERAVPHLIRFPEREIPQATDPLPEGVEIWEPGDPVNEVDWTETASRSPVIFPGVTTVKRVFCASPGTSPERQPLDIYIGIDCSGSMGNPAYQLSYPVLAGVVIAVSALRAGAAVMACLSGEPGEHSETQGFVRSEQEVLKILTGYLGTGYSFGVGRLDETFLHGPKLKRPTHLFIVSDCDFFHMLRQYADGWGVAERALALVGGGGTIVLELPQGSRYPEITRLEQIGWKVHCVASEDQLVAFARAFSREKYEQQRLRAK
jgi:hypothetical protein